MDVATILSSGVIAGIVAGFVTLRTSERNISIENITKQRQVWRDKIRSLTININSSYSKHEHATIKLYYTELQLLLNPDDDNDKDILDTVWGMQEEEFIENLDIELSEKVALLLKHDWERAKLEAKSPIIRIINAHRTSYRVFKNKRMAIKSIKATAIKESITNDSFKEKVKTIFMGDPKPIFDHIKNIGAAAVLVVGAEMLRNLNLYNYHPLYGYLIPVSSITLFIMASLLIIKSVFFASKSLSLFFFDKDKLDGVSFKIFSAIIWLLYTFAISAMMFISIFGTIENKDSVIDVQHELSGGMHLNVDKARQSFDKLKNENRSLKDEVEKLKNNDK